MLLLEGFNGKLFYRRKTLPHEGHSRHKRLISADDDNHAHDAHDDNMLLWKEKSNSSLRKKLVGN